MISNGIDINAASGNSRRNADKSNAHEVSTIHTVGFTRFITIQLRVFDAVDRKMFDQVSQTAVDYRCETA